MEEQAHQRGECTKIPEPKTPYNEREGEVLHFAIQSDEEKDTGSQLVDDVELKEHLREAHLNAIRNQSKATDLKLLNEQLMKEQ
ncbi:MAG: hypothetical protein JST59_00160 [Actinobacteria bacterium]|nr:hypothetical protein [Actinomycetota bacterium]